MEASFPEPFAANNLATAIATAHGKNGYAVSNRFEVIIAAPMANFAEQRRVSLRCETVSLPGRNLDSMTDTNIYGPTREIVKGVTYAEDVSLSFVSSGGLEERVFFEEWQKLAFNEETWNVNYYNDYIGTIEVYLLDKGGKPAVARQPSTVPGSGGKKAPVTQESRRYGIKLWEAYPKSITATDLSQSSNSEIIRISVGFSFRYWTSLDGMRQPSTGPTAAPTGQTTPLSSPGGDNTPDVVSANITRNFPRASGKGRFPAGPGDGLL